MADTQSSPSVSSSQAQQGVNRQAGGPPAPSAVLPCLVKTWIEFYLLDMEGNALPNKLYIVRTPDGKELKGSLDKDGHLKLENLDPGSCAINFPEYDCDYWERI
jgi:hypothetical protein